MYNLNTLRKKASAAGYSIHKGFSHYLHNNFVVVYNGERMTGYNVIDETTNFCIWGCYDNVRDHIWQIEDVEAFLKKVYKENDLIF